MWICGSAVVFKVALASGANTVLLNIHMFNWMFARSIVDLLHEAAAIHYSVN
jgi:hypothetical protein